MLRPPWWQITTTSALASTSPNRAGISRSGTSFESASLAFSYSQGSRTSSNTGLPRAGSFSHSCSAAGAMFFTGISEPEARGPLAVGERRDQRLEQLDRAILARRAAMEDLRGHHRRLADHREGAPA